MLKEFEASGKTLDEAIDMVCLRAGRTIDELNIEVISMPSKGIFGIGHKDARVRASFEVPDEPAPEEKKASTYGQRRSKQERFEKKQAKAQENRQALEIPTVTPIDPSAVTEEMREQARSKPSRPRPERDRSERSDRGERGERGDRGERQDRGNRDNRGERAERGDRPARSGRGNSRPKQERRDRPDRGERTEDKTNFAQEAEARKRAASRRESHATPITEGEMAAAITEQCRMFLEPIFAKLRVQPGMEPEVREGVLWLCFTGSNLGLLIGRRGETLNALQYLTNLTVNKNRNDHIRVVLDVEGYREGREETLAALARKMADKAVRTGRRVELEPMNPHERRVVHLALQNDKRVDTVSHGEEPYRRVVIIKKNSGSRHRHRGGKGGNRSQNQNANQAMNQVPVAAPAPLPEAPVGPTPENFQEWL